MVNAAALLRQLSEPWSSGERVKTAIWRAAELSGLNYWRAFDIWYGKARRIEPHEIEQIKQALKTKHQKAAVDELVELKKRIARLEIRLAAGDTDFFGPPPDLAGVGMRVGGGGHRAMAAGMKR
jgi:hypothetical protein